MPAGGMVAEIVIEGHDAVHFGARKIQRVGDHRKRFLRHVTEFILNLMQDRQQRAFQALELVDDRRVRSRDIANCMASLSRTPSL